MGNSVRTLIEYYNNYNQFVTLGKIKQTKNIRTALLNRIMFYEQFQTPLIDQRRPSMVNKIKYISKKKMIIVNEEYILSIKREEFKHELNMSLVINELKERLSKRIN